MFINDINRFYGTSELSPLQIAVTLMIPLMMIVAPHHSTQELNEAFRAVFGQVPISTEELKNVKYTLSENVPADVRRYQSLIEASAKKYDVDANLIAAVIAQESNGNPNAESYCGARGLMQLMPATAGDLGYTADELWDPAKNIDAGTRYLSHQLKQFDGDIRLAAAAYNAGPGNVIKHGGVPDFQETRGYVIKVLQNFSDYNV